MAEYHQRQIGIFCWRTHTLLTPAVAAANMSVHSLSRKPNEAQTLQTFLFLFSRLHLCDRLCGLVVKVLGYRSGGPGSIPGTTRKKKKSSRSGTGSTQPREYN
jgi:hypothetical protein